MGPEQLNFFKRAAGYVERGGSTGAAVERPEMARAYLGRWLAVVVGRDTIALLTPLPVCSSAQQTIVLPMSYIGAFNLSAIPAWGMPAQWSL